MRRSYHMVIRVRGATNSFREGMPIGALAVQELTFDLEPHVYQDPMFSAALMRRATELIEEIIQVDINEITDGTHELESKDR